MPNHQPGPPRTAHPPRALTKLVTELGRDGTSVGLTTTSSGEWALLVRVPPAASTPIPEIERRASGFPVIYETATVPVARPAFPDRGE
jgi:hypothetical protein